MRRLAEQVSLNPRTSAVDQVVYPNTVVDRLDPLETGPRIGYVATLHIKEVYRRAPLD